MDILDLCIAITRIVLVLGIIISVAGMIILNINLQLIGIYMMAAPVIILLISTTFFLLFRGIDPPA
jgi:hypothetical protein